jgi:hypothetical protein
MSLRVTDNLESHRPAGVIDTLDPFESELLRDEHSGVLDERALNTHL